MPHSSCRSFYLLKWQMLNLIWNGNKKKSIISSILSITSRIDEHSELCSGNWTPPLCYWCCFSWSVLQPSSRWLQYKQPFLSPSLSFFFKNEEGFGINLQKCGNSINNIKEEFNCLDNAWNSSSYRNRTVKTMDIGFFGVAVLGQLG